MSPDALREWREARGMTQKDLANLAGVHLRTVDRWERGMTPIPKLLEVLTEWFPSPA